MITKSAKTNRKQSVKKDGYVLVLFIILVSTVMSCSHMIPSKSGAADSLPENLSQGKTVKPSLCVVRVNVSRQGYYFHRPWQKRSHIRRTAIGAVVTGSRVLVTSNEIADYRYIELEKIETGQKSRAKVRVVDYEANLALLEPEEQSFLDDMTPLPLSSETVKGEQLDVWQVNPNGDIISSRAPITSIEPTRYPYRGHFLVYRLNSSLQFGFGNFTLPVVKDHKLAGLVMSYDAKSQTIDVVPPPVIRHFLEDFEDGSYSGFPSAGLATVSMRDPQLRKYCRVPENMGGVYVENVIKDGPAQKAGIVQGDVVVDIGGYPLDSRGNFNHPLYGKLSLSHLTRCMFHVGDTITFTVFRENQPDKIDVILEHRSIDSYTVPYYFIDREPRYYILGGLVLVELTGNYLGEYGKNWTTRGPVHLVYYMNHQDILSPDRKRIVIVSHALPTSYTMGNESFSNMVVTRINDKTIDSLDDVPTAIEHPVDGFHKVEFEQRPKVVFFDPDEMPMIDGQIKKMYNIQKLHRLD